MARVGAFCVDLYEAHLVTRRATGELERHAHDRRPDPTVRYEARSASGVFPQAYVSRPEAAAACANAGKRLCTLAEWERACRGDRRATYPYGDRWKKGVCNTHKPHLITLLFGADARRWRYEQFNDPALDDEPGFLGRAGDQVECVSEDGVRDLVGNLHEWVSDTVDSALIARLATEGVRRAWQPVSRGNGVFVGGFFSTAEEHGPGCRFLTAAHEPAYHDYSTGFRCCSDARSTAPN